jgi:hypothetical protein
VVSWVYCIHPCHCFTRKIPHTRLLGPHKLPNWPHPIHLSISLRCFAANLFSYPGNFLSCISHAHYHVSSGPPYANEHQLLSAHPRVYLFHPTHALLVYALCPPGLSFIFTQIISHFQKPSMCVHCLCTPQIRIMSSQSISSIRFAVFASFFFSFNSAKRKIKFTTQTQTLKTSKQACWQ